MFEMTENRIARLYNYACHEDEAELCGLELRVLFGEKPEAGVVAQYRQNDNDSDRPAISVSRSPFLKRRMDAAFRSATLEGLAGPLGGWDLQGQTFKVYYTVGDERHSYEEKRAIERQAGGYLLGKADMHAPMLKFGVAKYRGEWLFGPCEDNDGTWLSHQSKPQNYSTALPVRAARALVNIAIGPSPRGRTFIDPCCGMGTVLIEALSMGIRAEGIEINPLAARGARVNLEHFGYSGNSVVKGDMTEVCKQYDAAVLDMPYNLCSVLPSEEQYAMLMSLRRMAARAVVVTTEDIQLRLTETGFRILDCAKLSKGPFKRFVSVVE
jgi:precorrin-6B methylase 2